MGHRVYQETKDEMLNKLLVDLALKGNKGNQAHLDHRARMAKMQHRAKLDLQEFRVSIETLH